MLMLWKMLHLLLILLCAFPGPGFGKVCTNTGVSHTLRSRYLATFESDVGRSFITKYPSSSGSDSEAQFGNLEGPDGGSRRIMLQRQNSSFLEGASLHNVRLSPDSLHGRAQQTNLEYLLMLDVDNLVYSFRTNAGVNASGSAYGGWESPDSELRGHFVGHYLSATALMWASTHNATIFKNMNAVVKALAACQQRLGTGYLSAFPTSLFDRFESLQPVWAPYYTIHKIMAGLLDQYTLAKNKLAFKMVLGMAQYFSGRVDAVIKSYTIEKHWQSLNEETGGMNDVTYRLYQITGNEEHLQLAHLFDKPCFLGLLAVQADSISGFHANTHIPVVIGAQMRYEATGDELYKELTQYFLKIVSSSHTYATGGTSVGEFWSDPNRLGSTLDSENEESCTTYNMLKVARNLFRWTKEMHYADFYERALLNGVLSIQRGQEPGVMIYMLPLRAGSSKAKTYHGWGTPYDSFWCCYGTATESFSKLGDSIFFEEKGQIPHLYAVQFVSSIISWNAAGLLVNQAVQQITSFNPTLNVTFNFTQLQNNQLGEATFSVRVPNWAASTGCESSLNGVKLEAPTPGAFFAITRQWKTGDTVSFSFLATVRLERIQDDEPQYSSLYAIYFGPYLLAGMSDDGDFKLGPVNVSSPSDWIVPVSGNLFTFAQYRSSRTAQALISTKDGSLSMANMPLQGSEEAPHATFRVRTTCEQQPEFNGVTDLSSWLIYKEISLELMDQPGKYVAHSGIEQSVTLLSHDSASLSKVSRLSSAFRVRPGLSGEPNSVSFEASEMPGCFLSTQSSGDVLLECKQNGCKHFEAAASFSVLSGVATYHPMSFSAHGSNRTFLLFPLNAYKDEKYTVYFEAE